MNTLPYEPRSRRQWRFFVSRPRLLPLPALRRVMSSLKHFAAVLILCGRLAGPHSAAAMPSQLMPPGELRSYERARSVVDLTPGELRKAYPELYDLEPARSQHDLGRILQKVGEGVEAFIRDFPNTASIESVRRERVDRKGIVQESDTQTFNYLAVGRSEGSTGGLSEIRTDNLGRPLEPHAMNGPSILTIGFASMVMYFHPKLQPDSTFRYLGHLTVEGRDANVVAFAQRPEAAQVGTWLEFGSQSSRILMQGIAQIDADSSQILQMRVDLLAPRPDLGVNKYSTELHYGKVRFRQISKALWTPHKVVVTLDLGGQLFRNYHQYSHFNLFNVEAKIKEDAP